MRGDLNEGVPEGGKVNFWLDITKGTVFGGLTGTKSKRRLVAIAGTTSADTLLAKRLLLVALDLPDSILSE